ncbi:MAG: NAD(P)-dependent alcohol dehydrogenase [Oscillospiraceae bacterium]|nr:NAD(P)-dependent alcohol dehydrogenase [Oscillospiraceae bacterium]
MKMKAAVVWEKDGDFKLQDVELAEPKATEVLVRVVGAGVCHTDATVRDQTVPIPLPAVLGHEGSGIVEKVGEAVRDVKVGDRVVMTFYTCGHCPTCRSGRPTGCSLYAPVNFSGMHGDFTHRHSIDGKPVSSFFAQSSFAEYAVVDENACVVINDEDVDIGLLGPLGCGFMTGAGAVSNCLKPEVGSSIVVFGCGGVGLTAVMMAKAVGCGTIIGVDAVDSRLEMAKELGCTHVINGREVEDIAGRIVEITGGGADYSLDTSAAVPLMMAAINCLRVYGTAAVVGTSGDKVVPVEMQNMIMGRGRTLKGCIEGDADPKTFIPKLVSLYKQGRFPFDRLITEYPFEQIGQAFDDSKSGKTIKPVLRISGT